MREGLAWKPITNILTVESMHVHMSLEMQENIGSRGGWKNLGSLIPHKGPYM